MSAQVIRFESGPLHGIVEIGDPLPAKSLQAQGSGLCESCVPFTLPIVVTELLEVPPQCLPLPEVAVIPCPDVRAFCESGMPQPLGEGLVSVPVSFTFEAHPIFILAENGEAVCIGHVPEHRFPAFNAEVSCPTTEGVSCTCRLSPILCKSCDFFDGREFLQCTFNFTLTVECEACRPVRGLGPSSTRL